MTKLNTNYFVTFLLCFSVLLSSNSHADTLTNFQQTLKQHQGKVIYLDFWASWCGPCRASFPWLEKIKQQYQSKNVVVLSVNLDTDLEDAKAFIKQNHCTIPVTFDPQGQIAEHYQLKGMPSSFIIDTTGKIRFAHVVFFKNKETEYESHLKQVIKG